MDAISGFKLLADSTDTVFSGSVGVQFSSFRDPSFSLSTELANFYNTQCNNIPPPRHPLLGDDVQVVNPSSPTPAQAQPTPGSPFHPPSATHLPSNGASPTTAPTPQPMKIDISSIQQHSPKPNSQPQQAASHPQQMTAPLQQQHPQHHQMQEQRVQQSPQQPQQVQHVPQVLPQHVRLVAQQQAAAAQVQQQQQRLAKSQDPQSARPQPNAHHTPAVVKGLINQDSSESDEEDELASMDDDGGGMFIHFLYLARCFCICCIICLTLTDFFFNPI